MKSEIRNPKPKILIVGAGPAGTSAAIRLVSDGFSVTLIERERFPRQKLCGEFVSPECFAHFRRLGVLDEMMSAGGDRIDETVFYAPGGKSVSVPSKWFNESENALGLSRAEMDLRLLERAKAIGVEVYEETSAVNLLIEGGKVRGVKAKGKTGETFEIAADLTIDATGRASVLANLAAKSNTGEQFKDKSKNRNPKSKIQNRLVGFKTHLRGARIEPGVCEIYFFRGGYGGLNLVEGGAANHCFLIRAEVVKEFDSDVRRILENVVFKNRRAFETLSDAVPIYDWLAVSIDNFGLKNLNPAGGLVGVGDAAAFIDPFTGSGMLMALESGELLAQSIAESSCAEQIAENYALLHARKFQRRLRVCSLLRRAAFAPGLANLAVSALGFGNLPRKLLARATRPRFSAS